MTTEEKAQEMKIGTRYYLDGMKDTSGIYVGNDHKGNLLFDDMIDNYMYLENLDGLVPMPKNGKYTEVEAPSHKQ